MAKYCEVCNKKLSIFSSGKMCKDCLIAQEEETARKRELVLAEINSIKSAIVETKKISEDQLTFLNNLSKDTLVSIYTLIFEEFENVKELGKEEIEVLTNFQNTLNLPDKDIKFDERIKPYIYVNSIRSEGTLPKLNLQLEGGSPIVLKKGEILHHADNAILSELRSVSLGYKGGSHGISIPLGKGFRYRVGSHKGHIQREEQLVDTSRGVLLVSNQRMFLHPAPGHKPLSIPLNKILSYHCYGNGIEIFKDGREKGYFLKIQKSESVELFGICLAHLLGQA